ncbi:MAG: SDR family oxidoreductase [Burkholderiaceae bacterium]|jgi:NAD(P)-dependent dehydrogenase (short-subunit alcohol dehydrogenase family)|nr:SDR family oxidoreductase [Burkholderiaceae bacterium]MCO5103201.1 SDR family oxidoreductase [Burkholderiaceae bacterium]
MNDAHDRDRPEESSADAAAENARRLQQEQEAHDRARNGKKKAGAPAAPGPGHPEPSPPLPAQHLAKPGREADLAPPPRFEAKDYRGSGKLQGMCALVTGADSGIGRAVAVLFAREGADVAVLYLNEHEDAQETQRHVQAEGRRCLLLAGDVKDRGFCREAVEHVLAQFGRLDVLVNNAAFQLHAEKLEDLAPERWDETFKTNIYGYFHMAQAALPHLPRGGCIVNTGSVTGINGSGHLLDYASTKGAIHAFTLSLAKNLAPRGIRVNAVAPGPVWTPLNPADKPADEVAEFGKDTDLGRPAQPEEIAPAYVFLASPVCSSYLTGIVLPITGSVG